MWPKSKKAEQVFPNKIRSDIKHLRDKYIIVAKKDQLLKVKTLIKNEI